MGTLCPGFDIVPRVSDAETYDISNPEPKTRPDIAFYPSGLKRKTPLDWSLMDMFVEWRAGADRDAYRETFVGRESLDCDSKRAFKLRGQMLAFVARLMDSQHRLCVYAVDIYGDRARLYRFDTSSVVVSEPILFREDGKLLDQFFLRYSAASPVERAFDPTVIPATVAEKTLFQERGYEVLRESREEQLTNTSRRVQTFQRNLSSAGERHR